MSSEDGFPSKYRHDGGNSKKGRIMQINARDVKNKIKRTILKSKQRGIKKQDKFERRKEQKSDSSYVPKPSLMQEDLREKDDTILHSNEALNELKLEEDVDEFSEFYKSEMPPKLLVTTEISGLVKKKKISKCMKKFIKELKEMFPNSHYLLRSRRSISQLQEYCIERKFTNLMIIGERNKMPYSMIVVHLPEGPTAFFRLSSYQTSIGRRGKASSSNYHPELILNNFNSRLGLRVARMFGAMIPQKPQFTGRRVITFHNQRDFIFVRHHRYEFENNGDGCNLQEIGPSFTMRIEKLQTGKFNGEFGEFEWHHKPSMDTSRRRFFL